MSKNLIDTWSKRDAEEDSMTTEHAWIWREMIAAVGETDFTNAKVLDFGCNQGGFLRLLYDLRRYAAAVGVDIAQKAVARAEAQKGDRPITYRATDRLSDIGDGFDIAFSHEVIYLIEDLERHADDIRKVVKPGGDYYAVTCCHSDSPLWHSWRPKIQEFSNVPVPNHSVSDIAEAFRHAGFQVSVQRFLASAFVPLGGASDYFPTDADRIETYSRWKLMFRFTSAA